MPLKTNVGISRKVSDNSYGSRGASVNLEVELDSGLIQQPERFLDRIRQVFRLAQQAVDEELAHYRQSNGTASQATNASTNGHASQPSHNGSDGNSAGNGHANGNSSNGNGHRNGNSHRISEKQLTFIRQLAVSIRGLGVRRLDALTAKMFGKPLADLSSMDGSGLIDTLKAIKAGSISLDAALEGSAS